MTELALMLQTRCHRDIVPFVLWIGVRRKKEGKERRADKRRKEGMRRGGQAMQKRQGKRARGRLQDIHG